MPRFDVTIAGELNLDLILYGLPEQLPARARIPGRPHDADAGFVLGHRRAQSVRLGSRVGFQSRIGDDPLGQIALERLQQGGVDDRKCAVCPAQLQPD